MSDDEEGEYNTIRHISSGRGVKLLYSKSKVSISLLIIRRGLFDPSDERVAPKMPGLS